MPRSNGDEKPTTLDLFGGTEKWDSADWTASDDRVRGGSSESHLCCSDNVARFYGTLDIETLGGAGFASQRTTADDLDLDLSTYAGIKIYIKKGDKKRYTFNLKDNLLPPSRESGREQSTISFECDFELPPEDEPGDAHDKSIFIPWDAFTPTYRGKPKKDAEPLDLKNIKRISIMIRSFFGAQEGDFSLSIRKLTATSEVPAFSLERGGLIGSKTADAGQLEDGTAKTEKERKSQHLVAALDVRRGLYTLLGLAAVLFLYHQFADRRI